MSRPARRQKPPQISDPRDYRPSACRRRGNIFRICFCCASAGTGSGGSRATLVGANTSLHGTNVISASGANAACSGTFAFYPGGAVAVFLGAVAVLRGSLPVGVRPLVFFDELHDSADKRHFLAGGRSTYGGFSTKNVAIDQGPP